MMIKEDQQDTPEINEAVANPEALLAKAEEIVATFKANGEMEVTNLQGMLQGYETEEINTIEGLVRDIMSAEAPEAPVSDPEPVLETEGTDPA